jgi:hypothetical protein
MVTRRTTITALLLVCVLLGCEETHDPSRTAEKLAIPSSTHPFAGFWKRAGCRDDFGFAIAPAGVGLYSVSFCGPGGCFKPGTYVPNTPIVGDSDYKIIDSDTLEMRGSPENVTVVRCVKREAA